jgi:hypothetical protein
MMATARGRNMSRLRALELENAVLRHQLKVLRRKVYRPRLRLLDLLACRRGYDCPDRWDGPEVVTAGVDVGRVLHVRISRWLSSGKAAPLFLGEVGDFTELSRLMDRYGVRFCLVDERPEERDRPAVVGRRVEGLDAARLPGLPLQVAGPSPASRVGPP